MGRRRAEVLAGESSIPWIEGAISICWMSQDGNNESHEWEKSLQLHLAMTMSSRVIIEVSEGQEVRSSKNNWTVLSQKNRNRSIYRR